MWGRNDILYAEMTKTENALSEDYFLKQTSIKLKAKYLYMLHKGNILK